MLQSADQPDKLPQSYRRRYFGITSFVSNTTFPALQWGSVILVSVFLAIFALIFDKLPPDFAPLFALAILGLFFLMVVRDVRRVLLAVTVLDISIQLDIYLFFDKETLSQGAISGFVIAGTTIALVGLYAIWLSELLTKRRPLVRRPLLLLSIFPALYIVTEILSIPVSRDPTLSLYELFLLVQMLFLYVYIVGTVRTQDEVLFLILMIILGLALQGLIVIGLHFYGKTIKFAGITASVERGRVGGTLQGPNAAAGYLAAALMPTLTLALTPKVSTRWKLFAVCAFAIGTIALIFTFSRGGWLGFIFATSLLGLGAIQKGYISSKVVIVAIVVTLIFGVIFSGPILDRITGDDNNSASSRIPLMHLALNMTKDHPIVGVGGNNFAIMIPDYATREFQNEWLFAVHNKYLLVWSETGTLGFMAFLAFLIVPLKTVWKSWKREDNFYSFIVLGLGASIMATLVHMNFDIFRSRVSIQPLWMSIALITAIYCIQQETAKTPHVPPNKSNLHIDSPKV